MIPKVTIRDVKEITIAFDTQRCEFRRFDINAWQFKRTWTPHWDEVSEIEVLLLNAIVEMSNEAN